MTTIAYKDGILACDRQVTHGNCRQECVKMWVIDDVCIVAAGILSDAMLFRDWWASDKDKTAISLRAAGITLLSDNTDVLVLDLITGELSEYDSNLVPMPIYGQFCAWGSGCDLAMGAMEAGADAAQAVDIAIKHDTYTGIGISVLNINEIKEVRNYVDWDHWKSRER